MLILSRLDSQAEGYGRNQGSEGVVCVSCRLLGSPCAYHTARAVRAPQSELARLLRAADAFPAPTGAGFEALVEDQGMS